MAERQIVIIFKGKKHAIALGPAAATVADLPVKILQSTFLD